MKMRMSLVPILTGFLFLLISAESCLSARGVIQLNDPESQKIVLARIGDTPVTVKELVDFAKSSPTFYGFLQIPGGPDKLLKELVMEKLLLLEGKDMKIPEPAGGNESAYLLKVKKELLPPPPPINEKEARKYYETHLEEFSTPLLLHLSQVKVYFTEKTRKQAWNRIKKALYELEKGVPFEQVAEKYSEEPISRSRGGDIGFVPSTSLEPDEVREKILKLKKGQVSDILTIGNSFTIVKLKNRREPIADPFDRVKDLAFQKAQQAKQKEQLERLRQRLEKKWHVVYVNVP